MTIEAFQFPVFQPAMRIISGISNSNPCLITTTFDNSYITGTIVRFDIPVGFGMQQLNQQFGPITVTSPTQFSVPIDSTFYDPFLIPSGAEQFAQACPIGEVSATLDAAVRNVLPYTATP